MILYFWRDSAKQVGIENLYLRVPASTNYCTIRASILYFFSDGVQFFENLDLKDFKKVPIALKAKK